MIRSGAQKEWHTQIRLRNDHPLALYFSLLQFLSIKFTSIYGNWVVNRPPHFWKLFNWFGFSRYLGLDFFSEMVALVQSEAQELLGPQTREAGGIQKQNWHCYPILRPFHSILCNLCCQQFYIFCRPFELSSQKSSHVQLWNQSYVVFSCQRHSKCHCLCLIIEYWQRWKSIVTSLMLMFQKKKY